MWKLEINRYYDSEAYYESVFDRKKDLIDELKKLGFKYDEFTMVFEFETEEYTYWSWIEKIDKNKIDKELLI